MGDKKSFSQRLFDLAGFQRRLEPLIIQSVQDQFENLLYDRNQEESKIDWNYMLMCASILAESSKAECMDAAYRISQYCIGNPLTLQEQKSASAFIMDKLTNYPAIALAENRGLISKDFKKEIPIALQLESLKRGIKYSLLHDEQNEMLFINRFQLNVAKKVENNKWVSISAPTSAGKSFILLHLVGKRLIKNPSQIIVYIVPTRALIQQVEKDIAEVLYNFKIKNTYLSSVPKLPESKDEKSLIFVLTQERFQWLLNEEMDFIANLVIVDEAQKIGDSSRGILLQQVIEEVTRRSELTKVIFSSPMTSNPGLLIEHAPQSILKDTVETEHITVNQNLIWVSQVFRKPKEWTVQLCINQNIHGIGNIVLPERPTPDSKRLPFIAYALQEKDGGNLIYANGPAQAEKYAVQIWDLQGEENTSNDVELFNLISLVKKVVNKSFLLAETLTRGVGFHYGNMPLIIKSEIERLFSIGKIKFLVCTSTLVEGVNLPAKSIFIRGPKKGIGRPMNDIDFWNLAGRAGRLGKEFQGNVICVDPTKTDVWESPPPRTKRKYTISRTVDKITQEKNELISYIENGTPRNSSEKSLELEHAFGYFLGEHIRNNGLSNSAILNHHEGNLITVLEDLIIDILDNIELPRSVILKNTSVSAIAQQNLFEYFKGYEGEIEELIPAYPGEDDAYDSYIGVIGRISKYLSGDHHSMTPTFAILVLNWMKGYSLSRIIENNWNYWRRKEGANKTLAQVIRETLALIEEYARFKFVKYSSCYNDVLTFFLQTKQRPDLLEKVPKMRLWLEFGASQGTQIALISLGFSRTSAILLSELITKDELDASECLKWLNDIKLDSLDVSPIIVAEAEKILKIHSNV